MTAASAPAKINIALVVGPRRSDGRHEVATVLQRVDLADSIELEPAPSLEVEGFDGDTIVALALRELAAAAGLEPAWRVRLEKRIPVAAGLGGGSADAATVLRVANETLARPLSPGRLAALAARLGADVPFFLAAGTQLGTADGTELEPIDLPLDYHVLLLLPAGAAKTSTAAVYEEFDARHGERGFADRKQDLLRALRVVRAPGDLAALPRNDLASSTLTTELEALGAFRADVSGAGPALYALFERESEARAAEAVAKALGQTWLCAPTWYG